MVARVLGREACRIRFARRGRALALLALVAVAGIGVPVADAWAKVPGGVHCYGKVCHRVKTLAETASLVGRTLSLTASYYDAPEVDRYNVGLLTSSGERFDAKNAARAASSIFPDGTELLIWNPRNGRAAHVRVNDFGPFHSNRTLDITRALAEKLRLVRRGVAELRVTVIAAPPPDEPRYRAFRTYPETKGYLGSFTEDERGFLSAELVREARNLNPPLPVRAPRFASAAAPQPKFARQSMPRIIPPLRAALQVATQPDSAAAVTSVPTAPNAGVPLDIVVAQEIAAAPVLTFSASEPPTFGRPALERLRFAATILSAPIPAAAARLPGAGVGEPAHGPATALSYLLAGLMLSAIALLIAVVTRPLHKPAPVTRVVEMADAGATARAPQRQRETTLIGVGLQLEGDIASNGEVVLEGSLKGDCRCRRLHVTATGILQGDVFADELVVEGVIVGNILARSVRADGQAALAGEVGYVELAVAREAKVNAICRLRAVAALMADDEVLEAA